VPARYLRNKLSETPHFFANEFVDSPPIVIVRRSLNWSKFSISGRTNILKFLNLTFNAVVDPYALNENGVIVNKFVWDENKKIGRLTDVNVSSGFRFAPKQNTKKSKIKSEAFKSSLILAGLGEEYED